MYNIGICDDGRNTCAALEEMVLSYAQQKKIDMDTGVWYTGEELCKYLEQGGHLDILFLDIESIAEVLKAEKVLAGKLLRDGVISPEEVEIVEYGLESLRSSLIGMSVTLIIGYCFDFLLGSFLL